MIKKSEFHKSYNGHKDQLDYFIEHFDEIGTPFGNQDRNSLKFDLYTQVLFTNMTS